MDETMVTGAERVATTDWVRHRRLPRFGDSRAAGHPSSLLDFAVLWVVRTIGQGDSLGSEKTDVGRTTDLVRAIGFRTDGLIDGSGHDGAQDSAGTVRSALLGKSPPIPQLNPG